MHEQKAARVKLSNRLTLIGCGLLFVFEGLARMKGGAFVTLYYNHQPHFSWGLVAGGTVLIVASLLPESWIVKAASLPPSKAKQLESAPFHGKHHKKHIEEKQLD